MTERLLERTLARFARARREEAERSSVPTTFRAVIEQRLRNVERQLDEVKGRINGLLFLLAGAVAAELLLRLVR